MFSYRSCLATVIDEISLGLYVVISTAGGESISLTSRVVYVAHFAQ